MAYNPNLRELSGGAIQKGMPLGNLTSQFFANLYLNELDQFVKHELKVKYYVRYVDDFVILDSSREHLNFLKNKICDFLKEKLKLELHPDKSKVINLNKGINFLGFRIFFFYKLIRKSNMKHFNRKFQMRKFLFNQKILRRDKFVESLEGWLAYCSHANSYKYRRHLLKLSNEFLSKKSFKIKNYKKHQNFVKKVNESLSEFTVQKTLLLFKKGLRINEIAKKRFIKESTVWKHLINLVKYKRIMGIRK